MKTKFLAAFAAILASTGASFAEDNLTLADKAAVMILANKTCPAPELFERDTIKMTVWFAAFQKRTDIASVGAAIDKRARDFEGKITTAERKGEFCAWAKEAAGMMRSVQR